MGKIARIILIFFICASVVSAEESVILNASIENSVISINDLSANADAQRLNISAQIISAPQVNAYIQNSPRIISTGGNIAVNSPNLINVNPQNDISVTGNILTNDVHAIPTELTQSIDLNLDTGSTIPIDDQNLRITQAIRLNKTYEINNLNSDGKMIVTSQLQTNKTEPHNISVFFKDNNKNMVLSSNNVMVNTNLVLELDSSGVYVKTGDIRTEIKNLPDMITEITQNGSERSVELKIIQQEPVYEIRETRHGKILGIFPASMDVEILVNASNKEIITMKEPWWSIFFIQ